MHRYFIKTPWWVQRVFSSYAWQMPATGNQLYLTFDDGPHPVITPWVLDQLKQYNAKATFFCIGKNVEQHQEVYERILAEGHSVGNHTHNHLNGWKTKTKAYLENIIEANKWINSSLFRPPYGKIRSSQADGLKKILGPAKSKIIMWDVLSADFDQGISPEQCAAHVLENATSGSIIVFHDSDKAWTNLAYALPEVLRFFHEKGFEFSGIA